MRNLVKSYYLNAVLWLLMSVTIIGICSVPADECKSWLAEMLISKAIGFGAGYISYKLLKRSATKGYIKDIEE